MELNELKEAISEINARYNKQMQAYGKQIDDSIREKSAKASKLEQELANNGAKLYKAEQGHDQSTINLYGNICLRIRLDIALLRAEIAEKDKERYSLQLSIYRQNRAALATLTIAPAGTYFSWPQFENDVRTIELNRAIESVKSKMLDLTETLSETDFIAMSVRNSYNSLRENSIKKFEFLFSMSTK